MNYKRVWAMPTHKTFDCVPIGQLVYKYLNNSKVSIDPFSGGKELATYTNDLNPDLPANYHLDAKEFLELMVKQGVKADLCIYDPPYSPRQIKECYDGIGLKMKQEDGWRTNGWSDEKDLISRIMLPESIFLYFGWDTVGMGKNRGFEIVEGLIVCHGPGHNDTLCTVEKRVQPLLI